MMAEIGEVMNVQVIIEGSMNSSNPYFSSYWRRDFTVSTIFHSPISLSANQLTNEKILFGNFTIMDMLNHLSNVKYITSGVFSLTLHCDSN